MTTVESGILGFAEFSAGRTSRICGAEAACEFVACTLLVFVLPPLKLKFVAGLVGLQ